MHRSCCQLALVALVATMGIACKQGSFVTPRPPGWVDAQGGQVTSDDQLVVVDVPAGAATQLMQLTVEPYDGALPASVVPGTAYRLGPEGTTFEQPVRVSIRFAATQATGADVGWLRLVAIEPETLGLTATWRPRLETGETITVRGETTHFSVYAVADLAAAGVTREITGPPVSRADLLFVMDNSNSTVEVLRQSLAQLFPAFLAPLESPPLDLHLGLVTTDLGAGPFTPPSCGTPGGDHGILQNTPRFVEYCAAAALVNPDDRYLTLAPDAGGGTALKNFTGSLTDAFTCYANVGTGGCGFEHVLGSMRAALDGCNFPVQCPNPEDVGCDFTDSCRQPLNAGFLRPDASLAIVIITDEDDCSAPADSTLFDPSQTALHSTLGPLTSYRCFQFGVTCEGTDPGRDPGSRLNCQAGSFDPDPQHQLVPVAEYASFLKSLKPDPRLVSVGILAGPPSPVVVGLDQQSYPQLQPSCTGPMSTATPGVRLARFAQYFDADRQAYLSICSENLEPAMAQLGERIKGAASVVTCLDFSPADVDPALGLQTDCIVETDALGDIPACDGTDVTCFSVGSAPTCPDTGANRPKNSLQIIRGPGVESVGTTVSIRCSTLVPR